MVMWNRFALQLCEMIRMTIRVMATTMAMMNMVKDDVASGDAGIDDDDGEHTLQQLQRN